VYNNNTFNDATTYLKKTKHKKEEEPHSLSLRVSFPFSCWRY
jgi:hypothetical protein